MTAVNISGLASLLMTGKADPRLTSGNDVLRGEYIHQLRRKIEALQGDNAGLRGIVSLLVEEVDDPCRRQPDGEAVYLSQPLIKMARRALVS